MFASPFGERFRFKTDLSLEQCHERLNELGGAESLLTEGLFDFSDRPVAYRWLGRVYMSFPREPKGPELIAKLIPCRDGSVEIRGHAGGNAMLFLGLAAVTAFTLGSLILDWFHGLIDWQWEMILLPVVMAGVYYTRRRGSHGGLLIDHFQRLLDARPIIDRRGDPIQRV